VQAANGAAVCTDVTVNGPVPVLFTLICWAPLVVPTVWTPNVSAVGDRVTVGCPALPLKVTACDAMLPPNAAVSTPVRGPATDGVKITLTSHSCPAATPTAQLSVSEKSPVTDIVGDIATSPKLATCTSWAVLPVPTF
jgi:hypothetical protein